MALEDPRLQWEDLWVTSGGPTGDTRRTLGGHWEEAGGLYGCPSWPRCHQEWIGGNWEALGGPKGDTSRTRGGTGRTHG